jgi:hyperosmotically inducible protein
MRLAAISLALLILFGPIVAAKDVSDDELYDKVRIQLANDREIGGAKIDVKVTQGVVELTGRVRTDKQKSRAAQVAKKVRGVREVVNNLRIEPSS